MNWGIRTGNPLRSVGRLAGLCLLAGIVLAGMLSPVVIGAGLLSNQVSGSVNDAARNVTASQLTSTQMPLVTTVLDRNGAPLAQLFDQYRLPVVYGQISPTMTAAIVAIEDRRFFSEAGVDPRSVLRAALNNSSGGSTQGASTITQQYVKNYLINVIDRQNPAAQRQDRADTFSRKVKEAELALQIGQSVPKEDILAGYLNVVEFSGNVYGIGAAAKAYFGTTTDKLTIPQSALLAGMVNNPNRFNPYTRPDQAFARRNTVIDAMVQTGSLAADTAASARTAPLGVVPDGPIVPGSTCMAAAPDTGFFCDYVVQYLKRAGFTGDQISTGGYTITTTLDRQASRTIKDAVEANVPTTQDGVANTFALVQPGQGGHQVLAMVSNRNYGTDAAQGERSTNIVSDPSNVFGAGSSFKIFTTAAALETGSVGFTSALPNPGSDCFTPPSSNRYTNCYPVANYSTSYPDPISLQDALATSPNVAFVGLEARTGVPAVVQMAQRLGLRQTLASNNVGGIPVTDPADPLSSNPQYNQPQSRYFQGLLSFTLGVSPISTLEMANVTATILSGGVWCPPEPILSLTDRTGTPVNVIREPCQQVVSPGLARTLAAGLSKDSTTGTSAAAARNAGWTRPDIGKTGTTNESKSVAFVGGVDGYAAASMVFADGSRPRPICPGRPVYLGNCGNGAFGGTVAAPPYFTAMNQILAGKPDVPILGPDPAYLAEGERPITPLVIGRTGPAAMQALQQADYPAITQTIDSTAPAGVVVGQSPQGNAAPGTTITLYVSATPPPR
ncbi:penicillin-binding protein [Pseudonocardia sp. GCM10023141]|uniref:penicillin-binding protein n=1 Tax=Pseudonocardia sp. GCM10023141 TaxID=3252653 RepID=UPI00360C2088